MKSRLFLALILGLPLVASAQVVVYQNSNPASTLFQPMLNDEELGDDVTLAPGTPRDIILFQVPITSNFLQNYTGTFTARFYLPNPNPGPNQGLPDVELWEGVVNVADGVTGDRTLTFPVPNVTVPDYFIWTLHVDTSLPLDDPEDSLGLILNDVPSIGSSDDFAFDNADGSGFVAYNYDGEGFLANFEATITAAVPEPGALTFLGLAGMALIRRRR